MGKTLFYLLFLCMHSLSAIEFPDVGGIPDFSKPDTISNRIFVLTNPKSGSHLLVYTMIALTERPMRGRLPLWHFMNTPDCYPIENILDLPVDFSKETFYFGHEFQLLKPLNRNNNKLIFILRDPTETICSELVQSFQIDYHVTLTDDRQLEAEFLNEIKHRRKIYQEYFTRLRLFDS